MHSRIPIALASLSRRRGSRYLSGEGEAGPQIYNNYKRKTISLNKTVFLIFYFLLLNFSNVRTVLSAFRDQLAIRLRHDEVYYEICCNRNKLLILSSVKRIIESMCHLAEVLTKPNMSRPRDGVLI